MSAKRPCRICRRWFEPNRRQGDRQRSCGRPACRREMHRRACARWREDNAATIREGRVRDRLEPSPEPTKEALGAAPLRAIDWSVVQALLGVEAATVMSRTGEVLVDWARDAMRAQRAEIVRESG